MHSVISLPPLPCVLFLRVFLKYIVNIFICISLSSALSMTFRVRCISIRLLIPLWAFEVNFVVSVILRNQRTQFISIPEIHPDKLQQKVLKQSELSGILILLFLLVLLRTSLIDPWIFWPFPICILGTTTTKTHQPLAKYSFYFSLYSLAKIDARKLFWLEEISLAVWSLQKKKGFKVEMCPFATQ